jgi:hypothetical protein
VNWKPQILKPRWQHKNAATRREAVAGGQEPELRDELPRIFREDEDAGVRRAAARRLDDLEILAAGLEHEADEGVRKVVEERLRSLTASGAENRAPLDQRRSIVTRTADRQLLEAVAASAPETELRMAAIARIERQGFLGDRAIEDPDPSIRRAAAAGVTQHSTLRRVIEGTRTSDKALHQELEHRLHTELLAAGDRDAVDREALAICQAVEHAAINPERIGADAIRKFEQQWARVADRVGPGHRERYERDLARLTRPPRAGETADTPSEDATAAAAGDQPVAAEPEAPAEPVDEGGPSALLQEAVQVIRSRLEAGVEKLGARKLDDLEQRWRQSWKTVAREGPAEQSLQAEVEGLLREARARLEALTARREGWLESGRQRLSELREQLEEGELHKALETRLALQELGKKLGPDRQWRSIQKEINGLQGRLRELRDWQHWSNDKIRKRMIKEMEALPATGLHPDAVLDRIKELQAQWKELEQSEQIPGDKHFAAAPWMWRKFNAAGRRAFETTKPFLDKRTEVQKRHLEKMQSLGKRIRELADADSPDWTELGKALGRARREMRSLGEVPARARHKMAARLKSALEAGNAAMQAHYEDVEKRKLKLIREAAQLTHLGDRDEAIRIAKSLQADWKAAGSLWRSRENELWREFRTPLDPLFEDLKAEQKSVREARDALLAEQKALCQELDAILDLDAAVLADQQGKVQGLQDRWKDIRHPDRRQQQAFQKRIGKFEQRLQEQESRAEQAMRARWREKSRLLHQAEGAARDARPDAKLRARLEKAWPSESATGTLEETLDQRFAAALAGEKPAAQEPDEVVEMARRQCICLEFLAGLPSPEGEKDLRMQYQVDRLSESLSGERQRMSAVEEAKQLEAEWLSLPMLPDSEYTAFSQRIDHAINAILTDK